MTKLIKKLSEAKTVFFFSLLYTILITFAFLSPINSTVTLDINVPIDKVIHTTLYFILTILWLGYMIISRNSNNRIKIVIVFIAISIIYGTVIEVVQELYIPTRGADLLDVFANTIGVILGSLLILNVKNRIKS